MIQFSFLDSLLRRGTDFASELGDEAVARSFFRSALPWLVALGAIYGFVMGSYSAIRAAQPWHGAYVLTTAVKVPLLLLFTAGICFPALYVFGIAGGAKIRAGTLWAALTAALLIMTLLLVALTPVVLLMQTTIQGYAVVKLMHLLVWTVAGIGALRFFAGLLAQLDPELRKNGRLMIFWMFTFGLVGAQSAWMMRPFIGHPLEPFRITDNLHGNVLQDIVRMLARLG